VEARIFVGARGLRKVSATALSGGLTLLAIVLDFCCAFGVLVRKS